MEETLQTRANPVHAHLQSKRNRLLACRTTAKDAMPLRLARAARSRSSDGVGALKNEVAAEFRCWHEASRRESPRRLLSMRNVVVIIVFRILVKGKRALTGLPIVRPVPVAREVRALRPPHGPLIASSHPRCLESGRWAKRYCPIWP